MSAHKHVTIVCLSYLHPAVLSEWFSLFGIVVAGKLRFPLKTGYVCNIIMWSEICFGFVTVGLGSCFAYTSKNQTEWFLTASIWCFVTILWCFSLWIDMSIYIYIHVPVMMMAVLQGTHCYHKPYRLWWIWYTNNRHMSSSRRYAQKVDLVIMACHLMPLLSCLL